MNGQRRRFLGLIVAAASGACTTFAPSDEMEADQARPDYRLGAGDQVRITVFNEPELSGDYLVNAQGMVAFPLIGDVAANGRTSIEFASAVADALRGGYVRQPNVTVTVVTYRPFFILGEVANPGSYPYSANLTVMNAVAVAGGYTYRANRGRVFIKHANEQVERAYRVTISTPVMPGDTIRVPERFF